MANFYPALKLKMGDNEYYSVSMSVKDIAKEINFADDVHKASALGELIQRKILNKGAQSIAEYLQKRHRFFNSLVVATTGGSPKFYSVNLEDNKELNLVVDQMRDSFGVLSFSGDQKYYALDGQHRLKALKALINGDAEGKWPECPEGLENDKINVLILANDTQSVDKEFIKFYRRTFSALNRYAKPTGDFWNVCMDEDDLFAIITRRLVQDHPHFAWEGDVHNHARISEKKDLRDGDQQFISLVNLYKVNITLLWDSQFQEEFAHGVAFQKYIKTRPEDEVIDNAYRTLETIWDAILETIKLDHDPSNMRHGEEGKKGMDYHSLYIAIGMVHILPHLVSELLVENGKSRTKALLKKDLVPLGQIDWSLWKPPFRHIALNKKEASSDSTYTIGGGSMSPKDIGEFLRILFKWIIGKVVYAKEELAELEADYKRNLDATGTSNLSEKEKDQIWKEVEKIKKKISG